MPSNTYPIVGAFYHPPAKALIEAIPIGTPLILRAEPDNPADPNAVAVWLLSEDIPETAYNSLRQSLPDFGTSLEQLMEEPEWHLGYIPRQMAAELRAMNIVQPDEPVSVEFSCSASGAPRVRFTEAIP